MSVGMDKLVFLVVLNLSTVCLLSGYLFESLGAFLVFLVVS